MVSWGSCQYVYHLVEVTLPDGSGPVQLVHMKLKKGTTTLAHLPLKEVYDKLVAPSFSYSYFYHKLKRIAGKPPATVQGDDRAMILRFGVSSEYANKIAVLPIGLAITTLRLLGGQPAAKVPILTAIKRQTAHMHILPLPQHMMQANPLGQAAPPQLQLKGTLPDGLLPCLTPHTGQHYGLFSTRPQLASSFPLEQQIQQLKDYSMRTFSGQRPTIKQSTKTWDNTRQNISLFLGFCLHFQNVAEPNLEVYLEPELLSRFVSFHLGAHHTGDTISRYLETAQHVLSWFQSQPGGKHASLQEGKEWMVHLAKQVRPMQIGRCMLHAHCSHMQLV